MSMTLKFDDYRSEFRPGETIRGTAEWQFDSDVDALEIRLFWYTSGKGTEDVEVVKTDRICPVAPRGSQVFAFPLPEGPYTFSGTLISLNWAIEMVAERTGDTERLLLSVSPTGKEIVLKQHESSPESV